MNYPIKSLLAGQVKLDCSVEIRGWIRSRRDSKAGFSFLQVYDGSCFAAMQAIASNQLSNYESQILHLSAGCSVIVKGKLCASQGSGQAFEIQAERVEVLGLVENPETYPISPKHHSLEYLREVAHLRARTNTIGALTRLRHHVAGAIHGFFNEHGFYWVNTPILTASDCEGAGELFKVSTLDFNNLPRNDQAKVDYSKDFFAQEAFLTVSGQLNVGTYCCALSKVYTFGPTFRSENSNTSRHLAEFWMIEPEMAFADLQEDADMAEKLLKHVFNSVLQNCQEDLQFFNERIDKNCLQRLEDFVKSPFEKMEYTDVIAQLQKSKKEFVYPVSWGIDLQSEHERYLAEELIGRPVVVMNYPKEIKAFYMRLNDDEKTVAAMDILAPGIGEIIGGSQREERLEYLDKRMDEMGLDKEKYFWYRDLRRYGTVPHAGFGLGFERLLSYITGLNNIRDVIPFPRAPGLITF